MIKNGKYQLSYSDAELIAGMKNPTGDDYFPGRDKQIYYRLIDYNDNSVPYIGSQEGRDEIAKYLANEVAKKKMENYKLVDELYYDDMDRVVVNSGIWEKVFSSDKFPEKYKKYIFDQHCFVFIDDDLSDSLFPSKYVDWIAEGFRDIEESDIKKYTLGERTSVNIPVCEFEPDQIPLIQSKIPTIDQKPATQSKIPTIDQKPATQSKIPTIDQKPATQSKIPTIDQNPATQSKKPTTRPVPSSKNKDPFNWLPQLEFDKTENINTEEKRVKVLNSLAIRALSGLDDHVRDLVLFVSSHPGDGSRNNCGILYDLDESKATKSHVFYVWDKKTRLWKLYESPEHCNSQAGNNIISRFIYKALKHILSIQANLQKLRNAAAEALRGKKAEIVTIYDIPVKRAASLVSKLQTTSSKAKYEKAIMQKIEVNFGKNKDAVVTEKGEPIHWLPMNDGNNIHVFTGEIRPRTLKDYHTFCFNACFDPSIKDITPPPKPEMMTDSQRGHRVAFKFMNKLASKDEVFLRFLCRIYGLYISGNVKDKSFIIATGPGDNGKSAINNIISYIFGSAVRTINGRSLFCTGKKTNTKGNEHNADIDSVVGSRMVIVLEGSEPGDYLNENFVKAVSGGDPQTVRPIYGKAKVNVRINAHIIMYMNNKSLPLIASGGEQSMKTRTMVVPMTARFLKKDNPDRANYKKGTVGLYLADEEIEGRILNDQNCLNAFFTMFMIEAQNYYKEGMVINRPPRVVEASKFYLNQMKATCEFADFFELFGLEPAPGYGTPKTTLYKLYLSYCDVTNARRHYSAVDFMNKLKECSFTFNDDKSFRYLTSDNKTEHHGAGWSDIRLKTPDECEAIINKLQTESDAPDQRAFSCADMKK
jgi:phage/plasmid-associated DNA primase